MGTTELALQGSVGHMQGEHNSTDARGRAVVARGWERLHGILSGLSLSFFGIGILRFWYQYNLYNLHATTDYGAQVALTNILRALVIGVLLLCAWRRELSPRARGILVWGSLILMTLSGVFYALDDAWNSHALEVVRYATCGVGLVWGGAMWMDVYARLSPARVLVCLSVGVALSCVLSLICSFFSPEVMSLVNLFVPVCSVLAYWRAMHVLSVQGHEEPVQVDRLYDERYSAGVGRAVLSFCLFTFVLGIALGFPDGTPRELPPVQRVLHQVILVVICLYAVWWVVAHRGKLWFPAVWCFENALLIAAIVLLVSETPGTFEVGTAFMLMAESVFYPFVFFVAYDLGRHMRRTAMYMLGVLYGGALFCMGAGRLLSFYAERVPGGTTAMTVLMSVLVVIELVVALRFTATSGGLPLFSDVQADAQTLAMACASQAPKAAAGPQPGAADASSALSAAEKPNEDNHVPPQEAKGPGVEASALDRAAHRLHDAGLTTVEMRIVELIAHGRSRAVIARDLGYSENTIRNYTRNIYHKLNVHSKQELLDLLGVE